MLPDWKTIRVDERASEAFRERFPSIRCFTGDADAQPAEEHMLLRAGDAGTYTEGALMAKGVVDGRSVFVAQLLHVEGDHDWALPLLIAFDQVAEEGLFRVARCVELFADGIDDLEPFRSAAVRSKLKGLDKMLAQQKAMAALLPPAAATSTQAYVDQLEGSVAQITTWLKSSGRHSPLED